MDKDRRIIKKPLLNQPLYLYIGLFLFMLAYHSFLDTQLNDDIWFSHSLDNRSLFEYLLWRYHTWSSRLLLETVLIFFVKGSPWLWRIFDSLVVVLLVYSLLELFSINNKYKGYEACIIIGLIGLYPFIELSSAGWVATTVNYLWPLAFGVYALIPIAKITKNKRISIFDEATCILSLLIACNAEQMAAILFCLYLFFFLFYLKKDMFKEKRQKYYCICNMIVSFLSLIFIITCPGNDNRKLVELHWFEGFESLSLVQKLAMGFVSTSSELFYVKNQIYFVFISLILIAIWMKYKNYWLRLIGSGPLLFYFFCEYIIKLFFVKTSSLQVYNPLQFIAQSAYQNDFGGAIFYGICIINLFLVFLLFYEFYLLFNKNLFQLCILIYSAGLFSRIIVGLSPTFFVSGERTAIFLEFSIICLCIILILHTAFHQSRQINIKYLAYFAIVYGGNIFVEYSIVPLIIY